MNLAYKDSSIQNSECYLSTPSKNVICKINGTDPSSASYVRTLADIDELSFTVFRYINVDGQIIESNGYNEIKNNMYLYLTNFGWFKIVNEPEITTDTTSESKKVVAQSVECELLQYDLVGTKINTGETDSAEYLADNNIGADNLAKEYVTFYNPVNTQLSLLHLILEKVRGWEIGYVDESLKSKKFTFNIDSAPIYTFMRNELQQQSRCIFIFDNENYTINVYSVESFGQDTSIYLSMRNLTNNIDITCDDNNIYTCYHVAGGENLENINRVNFGNSYIENLSWYMQSPYMDNALKIKYQNWLDYREEKRTEYIDASEQYAYYYALATDVKNRVPVSDLSNTWQGYTLDELNTYKDFYTTTIAAIQSEFGSLESEIQKYPVWYTYIQYKEILSNINIAIKNYGTPSSDIDFSENWETNPELYGVDELSYKVEAYKEQLGIFHDYKNDFIDSNGNYKNWHTLDKTMRKKYANQQDYETKLESYMKLNETYLSFLTYLDIRTKEYNEYVLLYESFANTLKTIANDVLIENFHETFTEKELDSLNRLKNYTDYTNENILVLNTYDTSQELNAQKDLLRDAQEQLVISSQPQFHFSVDINNLLTIPEFQSWTSALDVGAFIYLEVRKDYIVKLRVTEISGINPFNMQENDLTLTFSNMVKGLQGIDDYNSLLGTSIGAAKNSIHSGSSASSPFFNLNGIELTTDILSMIANSHVFQNKFDTVYNNSVVSSEAKFNTAMVDNLVVKMAEIDEATIKNLKADSAFIKYLNSTLVVANEIKVDDLIAKMATIDIAKIKEIHSDAIFTNSLQSLVSSSVESTVDLQFVKTLIAGHATISDLFTNNFVIGSDNDGSICMNGSTMQFKDSHGDVYIQIGTDNQGQHSLVLKDNNGNILLNGNGITENAITDELIVSDMIKKKDTDYNGISGDCLDIDSVVTQINNGTTTIKSSQIYFDEENQSLNTKLSCMIEDINGNLETNYYTKEETPEQVISILGKTDISTVNGDKNSIIDTVSKWEQNLNGFRTEVSEKYTTKEDFEEIYKYGRNYLEGTNNTTDVYRTMGSWNLLPFTKFIKDIGLNSGKDYITFSAYINNGYTSTNGDSVCVRIDQYNESNSRISAKNGNYIVSGQHGYSQVSVKIDSNCSYIKFGFGRENGSSSAKTFSFLTHTEKLEKGKNRTDWCQAVEDISASMTQATQTANQFKWIVKSGTSESNMTLTDTILSLISEGVNITADHINLNGYTTINGICKFNEDGTYSMGGWKGSVKTFFSESNLYIVDLWASSSISSLVLADNPVFTISSGGTYKYRLMADGFEQLSKISVTTTSYPSLYGNGSVLCMAVDSSTNGSIRLKKDINNYGILAPTFNGNSTTSGQFGCYLGDSTHKWKDIYSTNSVIQTSDRNEKKDINVLDEKLIDFVLKLKPVSFKFKNGESGRTHYGLIAQDIEEILSDLKMTSNDFAGFIKAPKTKEIEENIINDDGEIVVKTTHEEISNEYTYGLRYEEFIAPMIKTIQHLYYENELLKNDLKELKNNIQDILKA